MPLTTFPLFFLSFSEAEVLGATLRSPLAGSAPSPNDYLSWHLPVDGIPICPAVINLSAPLHSRSSFSVLVKKMRAPWARQLLPGWGAVMAWRRRRVLIRSCECPVDQIGHHRGRWVWGEPSKKHLRLFRSLQGNLEGCMNRWVQEECNWFIKVNAISFEAIADKV